MADLLILRSRLREVGNSQVRRLLPAAKKQAVGPFLFFDHFGPEERTLSSSNDVRSERAPKEQLGEGRRTHGLQLWAGLPKALEDREPAFAHTPGGAISAADQHADAAERAVYAVEGACRGIEPQSMAVLTAGETVRLEAEAAGRMVLIGGEPLDGPRFMWWNFVSSSRDRIKQAAAEWDAHHTPRIPGETEWVPLPGSPSLLP